MDIISSLKKIKGLKIRRAEAVCKRLGLPRMQGTTKGGYGSVPLFVYLRSEPFFSLPPLGGLSMRDLRETSEMDLHEKKPTLRIPETRFAPMASLNKRPKTSEIIPCGDLKPQEPVEFELNKEVSRLSALHNLTNSISSNSALDTLRDKEQSLRTYIYPITHLASGHPFVYQKGRIAISRLRINSLFVMHNNNRLNPSLFGQDSPQLIRYCPILPNSHTEKDAKKTFSIDRFTRLVNISTSSHLEFKINYLIEFLRAISLQNRYASARFVSYDKRAVDNREEFHKDQPNLFESNFFSPYRGASSAYPKGEPILADTGHTRHVSFLKRHEVDSKTRPLLGGNTAGIPQASPMLNQIDITHNSLSGVLRLIQATTVMRMHSIGI